MTMTRKDYLLIADKLHAEFTSGKYRGNVDMSLGFAQVVTVLMDAFKQDNVNFNEKIFLRRIKGD
jgi:hypothetical protein